MFPVLITVNNDAELEAVKAALAEARADDKAEDWADEAVKEYAESEPEAPPAEPVEAPSRTQVSEALIEVARKSGRFAALEMLQRFDAGHLDEVPVERYAELLAACEEHIHG